MGKLKTSSKTLFSRVLTVILALSTLASGVPSEVFADEPAANITASLKLVGSGFTAENNQVQAGQDFKVQFDYQLNPNTGSSSYNNGSIWIKIPMACEILEVLPNSDVRQEGGVYQYDTVPIGDANYIAFSLNSPISPGGAMNLGVRVRFPNMVTPDETSALFEGAFTCDFVADASAPGTFEPTTVTATPITAVSRAADEWDVKKTVDSAQLVSGGTLFQVRYKLDVDFAVNLDANPDNNIVLDRVGRLGFVPGSFSLTDLLPTNYLTGGGPQFVSLTGSSFTPAYTTELNADGSLKSVTITNYRTAEGSFIPAGSPIKSEYYLTVNYPVGPYEYPYNQTPEPSWVLRNTANLAYTLVGEAPDTATSYADITLGWKELRPIGHTIAVTKKISVGGQVLTLTKAMRDLGYENAKFTLYTDSACTTVAIDIDGQPVQNVAVGDDGVAVLQNLRHGTYYLAETTVPGGFLGLSSPLEVVIPYSSTIQILTREVVNTASALGIVEMTKTATDATGAKIALAGAVFGLYQTDNTLVAQGTSGADGLIRFHAVVPGSYYLKEISSPSAAEYPVLTAQFPVTVTANAVAKPQMAGEPEGEIRNVSTYGKLRIIKRDSVTALGIPAAANFDIYGPRATQPTVGVDTPRLSVTVNGTYVSPAMPAGLYWVKETQAPAGYTADPNWIQINVSAGGTVERIVNNAPRTTMIIEKWGSWSTIDQFVALVGVTFDVYANATDAANGTNKITTLTTTADATGKAIASLDLDAGTYYFKETLVVPGYQSNVTRVYEVVLPAGQTVTTPVINVPNYGRIHLTKLNSLTSAKLNNAVFGIYAGTDPDCTGTQLATLTTGTFATGEALSVLLPAGNYYIKELTAPTGYAMQFEIIKGIDGGGNAIATGTGIAVTAGGQTDVVVKNDPKIDITVKKVDSVNTATTLAGARFALYATLAAANADTGHTGAGAIAVSGTTTGTGLVTFSGLNPNRSYWLKEITTPSNYKVDRTVREIAAGAVNFTYTVANERRATLRIYKTGTMDGVTSPLQGAVFSLYRRSSLTSIFAEDSVLPGALVSSAITSGANGLATYNNLDPGLYWVKETSGPDGYAVHAAAEPIEVHPGDNISGYTTNVNHVTINNEADKGRIRIKKVDSTSPTTPVRATFTLYKELTPAPTYDMANGIALDTGVGGTVLSGFLAPGNYLLRETTVTGNYTKVADQVVTIVAGQTLGGAIGLEIENDPQGRIRITKTALWNAGTAAELELPVPGAPFNIFKKLSDSYAADILVPGNTTPVATATTATDGTVTTVYLDAGDYWVIESAAPTGYALNTTAYAVTVPKNGIGNVAVLNVPSYGRLLISKRDLANYSLLLDGANFELYYEDAGGTLTTVSAPGETPTVQKTLTRDTSVGSLQSGTYSLGKVLTIPIVPGRTYWIRELNTSPLIQTYGYTRAREWIAVGAITAGAITEADVFNYKAAQPPGKKENSVTHAGIQGVWIGLFATAADAAAAPTDSTSTQLQNSTYRATHKILQAVQSGTGGVFSFSGLVPNATYYVREMIGAANYTLNTSVFPVTVSATGDSFTTTLTIPNDPYGRIRILKQATIAGLTEPLDGAQFTVYKAKLKSGGTAEGSVDGHVCDESCPYEIDGASVYVGTTGTEAGFTGTMLSGLLPAGDYIVLETAAPAGFTGDSRAFHVRVVVGATNTYLYNNPVGNTPIWGRFLLHKHVAGSPSSYLAGVTFKVQSYDGSAWSDYLAGGTVLYTFTTAGTNYLSTYLPPGTYRLVETAAPTGYTLNTTPTASFTIEAGKVTGVAGPSTAMPDPILVPNQPKGGLRIDKYGSLWDGTINTTGMSGVVFGLYPNATGDAATDTNSTAKRITTATTNSSGRANFTNIDAGEYWLKEESVGSNPGYSANLPTRLVTITAGVIDTTTLTGTTNGLQNKPVWGRIKIDKYDVENSAVKLAGATFLIYDNAACTGSPYGTPLVTDANGFAVSGLLDPAKTYWLKETVFPGGYSDKGQTVFGPYTVTANVDGAVTTASISNFKPKTVTVTKIDKKTSGPIAGVQIGIYASEAAATAGTLLFPAKTTGADGKVTFTDLQPNTTYYFKELTVPENYVDNRAAIYTATTATAGTGLLTIENTPMGRIRVAKKAQWTNADGTEATIDLDGAVFTIYRWTGTRGAEVGTISVSGGSAYSPYLEPGQYELVETTFPAGFQLASGLTNSFVVTVAMGETEETHYLTPIMNETVMGRFSLLKHAAGSESTTLDGAQFKLYRKTGETTWAEYPDAAHNVLIVTGGSYTSNLLPPGDYRLIELLAPAGYTLDETPIYFTITSARTVALKMANYAKASISILKYDGRRGTDYPLTGAKFKLFHGASFGTATLVGAEITVAANGTYTWTGLDAGTYWLQETKAPDGYALDSTPIELVIAKSGTAVVRHVDVPNTANMGRVKIIKKNEAGAFLEGAVFEIWSTGTGAALKDTVTIPVGGIGYSALLPVDTAAGGTDYEIREIKAATGYSLDERLGPLSQTVLVTPVTDPGDPAIVSVTFINKEAPPSSVFPAAISKSTVRKDDEQSLLLGDWNITYRLYGYTNGGNPFAMSEFTVTDDGIRMQSFEGSAYTDINLKTDTEAYHIKQVRVYKATDGVGSPITARVEYQTQTQLGTATWLVANEDTNPNFRVDDLATDATYALVNLPTTQKVLRVRVVYSTVGKNFTAAGIELDVVFNERAESAARPEIRRVENTAKLTYNYTTYSESGPLPQHVTANSNMVEDWFPLIEYSMPSATLTNFARNRLNTFYTGNTLIYDLTVTNHPVALTENDFIKPIVTMDLPPFTDWDQTFNGDGYRITTTSPLDPAQLGDVTFGTQTIQAIGSDGLPVVDALGAPVMTKRLIWEFNSLVMEPGETFGIQVNLSVSGDRPSGVTRLFSPAYLTSANSLPVTPGNPLGTSFKNGTGVLVRNEDVDLSLGMGANDYIKDDEEVTVLIATGLHIEKFVKGSLDASFVGSAGLSHVRPGDTYEYKLRIFNNDEQKGHTIRVIDTFPVFDDSYILRRPDNTINPSRSTELPVRPTLKINGLSVFDDPDETGDEGYAAYATFYYYTGETWSTNPAYAPTAPRPVTADPVAELPMLYRKGASADEVWGAGWTSVAPTTPEGWAAVSAIGIDFGELVLDKHSAPLQIKIEMVAPEYTADQADEFNGKLFANSAAVCSAESATSNPARRVENNEVKTVMELPAGSIGDYVWLDTNNDGLQDSTDAVGVTSGLVVRLHRTDTYSDDRAPTNTTYFTTTDSLGRYLFEGLPTNLLREGATEGSTNPADYIGGVLTTYVVEFTNPDANQYTPTLKHAGSDGSIDSDAAYNGSGKLVSDTIILRTLTDPLTGNLVGEENLDIDLGLVIFASLGDRVWRDLNRNGIQDMASEPLASAGLNGATVNLYRVTCDSEGNPISHTLERTALTRTITDPDTGDEMSGYYFFDKLVPGTFVVEFDVTAFKRADSLYSYAFTQTGVPSASPEEDSDAIHTVAGGDDRIRRSGVVTLVSGQRDVTLDAGVINYSALGGFAFDDQDFNDKQSLMIPLPGTVVTLYKETGVGTGVYEPTGHTATVGADGRYLFDHLEEGNYKVHFKYPDGYRGVNPHVGGTTGLSDTGDSDVEEFGTPPNLNEGFTCVIHLPAATIDLTWDGGANKLSSLGDVVWLDRDRDNLQDPGEPGIDGVKVTLQYRIGDGAWMFHGETLTAGGGFYRFDGLKGGAHSGYHYRVLFEQPSSGDYTVVLARQGGDATLDSDALPGYILGFGYSSLEFMLEYGGHDDTWDAGFQERVATVGDYVWLDYNRNGIQDAGEPGVPGASVRLYRLTGTDPAVGPWALVGEKVTTSIGYYRFTDLSSGYYFVSVLAPTGYVPTLLNANPTVGNSEYDSDAFNDIIQAGWVHTRAFYLGPDGFDLTWDFGFHTSPPTGYDSPVVQWLTLAAGSLLVLVLELLRRRRGSKAQG